MKVNRCVVCLSMSSMSRLYATAFIHFDIFLLLFATCGLVMRYNVFVNVSTGLSTYRRNSIVFSRGLFNDKPPTRPVSKLNKHGYTCIYLPLPKDIAICMDVESIPGPKTGSILLPHRYTSYLTTDRGYLTSKYVLECTFTGPHSYSNHVVPGRFCCESFAPGLLNMRSTPLVDARKKFLDYRGKRAGIRQKQSKYQRHVLRGFTSFEAIELQLQVYSQTVSRLVIYRPPPSSVNNLSTGLFMDEFSSLLESYVTTPACGLSCNCW